MNIPPVFFVVAMLLSAVIGFVLGVLVQSRNGPDREDW